MGYLFIAALSEDQICLIVILVSMYASVFSIGSSYSWNKVRQAKLKQKLGLEKRQDLGTKAQQIKGKIRN